MRIFEVIIVVLINEIIKVFQLVELHRLQFQHHLLKLMPADNVVLVLILFI